eukprot:6203957-Pleurochrysis_carterae.AAC.3
MARGGAKIVAGQVFVKIYTFTLQQLRARLDANSIIVPIARILQLLQYQHDNKREADTHVASFPVPTLLAHCPDACWRWQAASFSDLVSDMGVTVRPVHLGSMKTDAPGSLGGAKDMSSSIAEILLVDACSIDVATCNEHSLFSLKSAGQSQHISTTLDLRWVFRATTQKTCNMIGA